MATKGVNPFAKAGDKKLPPWLQKGDDKKKLATGGAVTPPAVPASAPKRTTQEAEMLQEAKDAKDREKIKKMGYAHGGSVSRADGIAQRGKTKGKMV